MKIAAVQMCSTPHRVENVDRACAYIAQAAQAGAALIVLPEFFNSIYFAQYWDKGYHALAETEAGPTLSAIAEAAQRHRIDVVATIYETTGPGLYFDTAFHLAATGEIRHRFRKIHPSAVLSLEKLYFRYGVSLNSYAMGDWRLGIGICYDMAFPETARCLAVSGAELLIAPYATSRTDMFAEVLRTRAFENGCYLAAANKVGREGDWRFGGGSLIAGPRGALLAAADTESETMITADISRDVLTEARIAFPSWRDRRPDLYGAIVAPVAPS